MRMYTQRIINKVPGNIVAESKKEKQGYIGDLTSKTTTQLNELLERQIKLLKNKHFIDKLPDKGERINLLKENLEAELKKRCKDEGLSSMLSALSLNGKQKEDLDGLEWTGKCAPGQQAGEVEEIDSDDDHNTLAILATHSGAGFHKKKEKVIKPEEPLIKPSDLEETEKDEEVLEKYAKSLCEKIDSTCDTSKKTKFYPFKTLNTRKVERKEVKECKERWEVTAATPPPPVYGDTKLVSLQESIRLQREQQHKLKEVQMRHAAERLAAAQPWSISQLPSAVGQYRNQPATPSTSSSEDELSEDEVHDEEHPDGGGVTIYNLVDDVEQH